MVSADIVELADTQELVDGPVSREFLVIVEGLDTVGGQDNQASQDLAVIQDGRVEVDIRVLQVSLVSVVNPVQGELADSVERQAYPVIVENLVIVAHLDSPDILDSQERQEFQDGAGILD